MEEAENAQSKLTVEFIHLPSLNLSIQENAIAVVRSLTLQNTSAENLSNLRISLSSEPVFANTAETTIDLLPTGERIKVESLQLALNPALFTQLTSSMQAKLILSVSDTESELFRQTYPIQILATNQWTGIKMLPELLAAFVSPQTEAIAAITQKASLELQQIGCTFDHYESCNPKRTQKQLVAIFEAIKERQIMDCSASVNYENEEPLIRSTETILTNKLSTGLDLATLFASCAEKVGLHPLIALTHEQVFAGAWLTNENFPDAVNDDASLLAKRMQNGEIAMIEANGMNNGRIVNFDFGSRMAEDQLSHSNFLLCLVDITRARQIPIHPLSTLTDPAKNDGDTADMQKSDSAANEAVRKNALSDPKVLLWERKLLDLTMRNSLLNLRIGRSSLQLLPIDVSLLEDALYNGDEFIIESAPMYAENTKEDNKPEVSSDFLAYSTQQDFQQKKLRCFLKDDELKNSLKNLYRNSRTSIEENGANTLYLAIGTLRWFETDKSEQPRLAPILLLPVEIIRKSIAKGYVIRSRDEEILLNITLLEMLHQSFEIDIPNLNPLPKDEQGVDVKLILNTITEAIKEKKNWMVEEKIILGLFSFNKFIMWSDLHNNSAKFAENKIVASLISGKLEWEPQDLTIDAAELDKEKTPADITLPTSADSSQLEAICEASTGKTFILHGPPGTGKSQTITNMIANALYQGKRVLFVAEKMAALSVVQRRLNNIGLAPFCLELHSNKAKKSDVLSQLKQTSEIVHYQSPENFKKDAQRLFKQRQKLNNYVEAIHKTYPCGLSLYEVIVRYLSIEEDTQISFPNSLIDKATKEQLSEWDDALTELTDVCKNCGHPHNHPLNGINIADYDPQLKEEIKNLLEPFIQLLQQVLPEAQKCAQILGFKAFEKRSPMSQLYDVLQTLQNLPLMTAELLTMNDVEERIHEFKQIIPHGQRFENLSKELSQKFNADLFSAPAQTWLNEWNEANEKWFLIKFFKHRSLTKRLKQYALTKKIEQKETEPILKQLVEYQAEKAIIDKHTQNLQTYFGSKGQTGNEQWNDIAIMADDALTLNNLYIQLTSDITELHEAKEKSAAQLSGGFSTFMKLYQPIFKSFTENINKLKTIETQLQQKLGISEKTLYNQTDKIEDAINQANKWLQNLDKLKDWYLWLTVYRRFEKNGIAFVADEFCNEPIETERITNIFHKSLCYDIATYIISNEKELQLFKGQLFDASIQQFRKMNHDFQELTQKELYAKLASNIPTFVQAATQSSEVGILQKNIRNKGRGMSIRKFLDATSHLIQRMCPCMMMSPISVAQYLDITSDKFDLVIFDEASQMPTSEAVGAIARGKNLVVVGDPKQMPPTNFFTNNYADEDNYEIEDLESILDDCLALSIPSKHLLWHYRSKHESLIAFSNSQYYENKLLTFPSPDDIQSKVSFVPIQGFYDKGKSRQNKTEAKAIVDEIIRRLTDKDLCNQSIGVVAFSSVQQSLIEDMLSDALENKPELEALAMDVEEPVFIKNLENVQGDERDIILFSVGYGPDAHGHVSHNFGPLNREGGERRLNVAVSRARYEMIVYSTLHANQIDLTRSSAIGVAGLKNFLDYAEKGSSAVIPHTASTAVSPIDIADLIAERLSAKGLKLRTHIGCSGFRIDIGIIDENNPNRYQLGILCDGENYRQIKTARDREIIQDTVLNTLGWHICKIWTLDWWENPENVIEHIMNCLEEAKKAPTNNLGTYANTHKEKEIAPIEEKAIILNDKEAIKPKLPIQPAHEKEYIQSNIPSYGSSIDSFLKCKKENIRKQIEAIMQAEAPISRSLICKKMLGAWKIPRITPRTNDYFDKLFNNFPYYKQTFDGIDFYWYDQNQYETYEIYRINSTRKAEDLPPQEIANCMKSILEGQISLSLTDLLKSTALKFSLLFRTGSNVDISMRRGLKIVLDKNIGSLDNNGSIVLS